MYILDVRVDETTYQEALEKVRDLLNTPGKHYIVTPNPEIVVAAQKDELFKEILNGAALSIPDGMGLVFWSRLTGGKLKERVTGTDLVSGLVAMAEEFDYRLFLLGGDSAGRAAEKFKVQSPKLKVAYAVGPLLNADGNPVDNEQAEVEKEALSKINKFKPEILLVAFGAPKQEKWIAKNMSKADFKVAIGVGGALSYISGEKKRAPKWVQNLGLEWLHRLVREPSRIKRQTALPIFVFRSLKELVFKK